MPCSTVAQAQPLPEPATKPAVKDCDAYMSEYMQTCENKSYFVSKFLTCHLHSAHIYVYYTKKEASQHRLYSSVCMLQDDDRELLRAALERIETLEKQVKASESMEVNPSEDEAEGDKEGNGDDDIVTPDGKRVSQIKIALFTHVDVAKSCEISFLQKGAYLNKSIYIYIYIYMVKILVMCIFAHVCMSPRILGYQH